MTRLANSITLSCALLVWVTMLQAESAYGSIYECTDRQGTRIYSDLGCPKHSELTQILQPGTIQIVTRENSTPSLETSSSPSTVSSRRNTKLQRAAQLEAYEKKRRACQEARSGLQKLRKQMRKGYRLTQARALKRLEDSLITQASNNCGQHTQRSLNSR